jgi:hypothetical protein
MTDEEHEKYNTSQILVNEAGDNGRKLVVKP